MKLLFATNNHNKVKELTAAAGNAFELISLEEAGIEIEIEETYDTLEENAKLKAETIFTLAKISCIAEDTGLEVAALDGQPGVKTARYAGPNATANENMNKLLANLSTIQNRAAKFRTVLVLKQADSIHFFEGICEGKIALQKCGETGFGYDPVFIPDGASKTFAEMDLVEKNIYSHRKKATMKLIDFLHTMHK